MTAPYTFPCVSIEESVVQVMKSAMTGPSEHSVVHSVIESCH
jgi:hypothetical protein